MYSYEWDSETGGILLNSTPLQMSKEPRPVYYKELDILGFDKYWNYVKDDTYPYMWAEANNYFYKGRLVAKTKCGTMYTAPEIIIIDEPEPNGAPLQFVDIKKMVEKNRAIIDQLAQFTIKKIYQKYKQNCKSVDICYVAFSGGKDSVVVLDLVQRALPHKLFDVVFGNTDMEFSTTLELVENINDYCHKNDINFYSAQSDLKASDSWDLFGPPARKIRWCCTVHKTAPVINKLCEIYNKKHIKTMMITGVRGDESFSRSQYDEFSFGKKLAGQYSFHPILEWSSAEVYLYIFANNLLLNYAYKLGFNRVGCIMCPNSSEKHEFIKSQFFRKDVDLFTNKIITNSSKDLSGENWKYFIEIGGWKTRTSGRELSITENERYEFINNKNEHIFIVPNLNKDWEIWYKTIGDLQKLCNSYVLEYKGIYRNCEIDVNKDVTTLHIENIGNNRNTVEFLSYLKRILIKSQYCVRCMTCVAECPFRNITMTNGKLSIADTCIRCHSCLDIAAGCLYYNSIKGSKKVKELRGINRYLSVGVNANWVKEYFKDQKYEPGNRKTDVMFSFLSDAGILYKKQFTNLGTKIGTMDLDSQIPWALMLCNLVYTSEFGWYNKNIPIDKRFTENDLRLLIDGDEYKKLRSEFWNGFKIILESNSAFQTIGFGIPEIEKKTTINGDIKKSLISISRTPWYNPDSKVILYSLYKFAEACGNYYQFSLTRLLNHEVESDGISPTEIFGLDKNTMEKILQGLAINYPEFISVSFTLDLDNINLKSDKTSNDVLELF